MFEGIDKLADLWNSLWTRALDHAIEAVKKAWDSILALFKVTDRYKKPVYPPMIESWYDGYISEIPFYTSGFL